MDTPSRARSCGTGPLVRAFRPDNTLLWAALIEDFAQGLVYQNSPSKPTVHPQHARNFWSASIVREGRNTCVPRTTNRKE